MTSSFTIDSFIGCNNIKENLNSFFDSKSQVCLMIIGQSGCGKTTLANLYLEKFNVSCFRPDYEEYTTHKDFVDSVKKFVYTKTMFEIFEHRQKVLFLDDIETLLTIDRYANSFINQIVSDLKKSKHCKLLITCSNGHEKKVTELKKKMLHVRMTNPTIAESLTFLKSITTQEYSKEKMLHFIKAMNMNIRSISHNVHMLDNSEDELNDELYNRVTYDKSVLEILTSIVAIKNNELKNIDIWLSSEPVLLCYIAYDNKVKAFKKDAKSVFQLVDSYASTAVMETLAYSKNDWFLTDICNLYRFGMFKSMCKDTFTPEYTTVLTKTSQYYTNLKRQKELSSLSGLPPQYLYSNISKNTKENGDFINAFSKCIQ